MVTGARPRHRGAYLKDSEMRGSTYSSLRYRTRARARAAGIAVAVAVTAIAPATASANAHHSHHHHAKKHTAVVAALYFGHKVG